MTTTKLMVLDTRFFWFFRSNADATEKKTETDETRA